MKFRSYLATTTMIVASSLIAFAQVASHAPAATTDKGAAPPVQSSAMAKPVVKVNGAVLTDIDLTREMYSMSLSAQQLGGIPNSMEADIRKGAMDMIIFEELLSQEAKRRGVQVPAEKVAKAEVAFR